MTNLERRSSQGGMLGKFFACLGLRKVPETETTLSCSLENLYKGTTKNLKMSWMEIIPTGGYVEARRTKKTIVPIEIKPGWKKGTRITLPWRGTNMVFVVEEQPHEVFERDGDDLIVIVTVPLVDALTGYRQQITTLDSRVLHVTIDSVISPGHEEVVKGEGMPIPGDISMKGDLIIKFNVKFPNIFNAKQKSAIKKVLPSSRFP